MKLNCIIIEDEPLARKGLENFIAKIPRLDFKGSFPNPLPAMEKIDSEQIDLIFLDIKMPELSGLSFLKTLKNPPMVIITTAYPNYALQGFELNVTDYLLKPFSFERFLAAVNKALEKLPAKENNNPASGDFVFIKCNNKIEKVLFDEILFIQAMENYVVIHTGTRKLMAYLTLKSVGDFLPANRFAKIHKSYIIAIAKIDSIEGNHIHIGNYKIPFNRNQKSKTLDLILKDKFLKR
ncbi:MAG TPA: LytTR family DNA-binding domain-containing protein [Moheibacter sp.]|nr:LytTR family DNA-binding domain-containing protein [Moheibacter sp.]